MKRGADRVKGTRVRPQRRGGQTAIKEGYHKDNQGQEDGTERYDTRVHTNTAPGIDAGRQDRNTEEEYKGNED